MIRHLLQLTPTRHQRDIFDLIEITVPSLESVLIWAADIEIIFKMLGSMIGVALLLLKGYYMIKDRKNGGK